MTPQEVADRLIAGWISEPPPHVVDAAVMIRALNGKIEAYERGMVEMQDYYKARGKTLQAHVVHNVRQKLKRVAK